MSLPSKAASFAAGLLGLLLCGLGAASPASAAPEWRVDSLANTTVKPGGVITYHVIIQNVGDAHAPPTAGGDANNCVPGSPAPSDPAKCITLSGEFPAELTPLSADTLGGVGCKVTGQTIACQWSGSGVQQVTYFGPQSQRTVLMKAKVSKAATGTITSQFQVAGGEAANTATTVDPTRLSVDPTPFGIDAFDGGLSADPSRTPSTAAGAHPYEQWTEITFNTVTNPLPKVGELHPVESTRDVIVDLPPGLLGNATVPQRCSLADLVAGGLKPQPDCPEHAQVGTALLHLNDSGEGGNYGPYPLFNMEPPPGLAARFAFNFAGTVVSVDAGVSTEAGYALRASSRNIPEVANQGTSVVLWGTPGDPAHDRLRACQGKEPPLDSGESCPGPEAPRPFLRNPTSCGAPGVGLPTHLAIDSWEHPGVWEHASTRTHQLPSFPHDPAEWGPEQGMEGCGSVPFGPSFSASPTTRAADSPSGLEVEVTMPQQGLEEVGAISESDLRDASVKLPAGMAINPAAAAGLGSCSAAEIGLLSPLGQAPIRFSGAPHSCPDNSKVGSLEIETPVLDHSLQGAVYLAAQGDNPFESLLAIYLVVEDFDTGIVLKLPGRIVLGEGGQLETVFDDNPQLPFSRLRVSLYGGPRAALRTPAACGTHTATASFSPWSGGAAANLQSSFQIDQGCGGGFDPKLAAGTQNPLAAATSPFVLRVTREDGSQELGGLKVALPPGLTGYLKGIPYCPDAALAAVSGALGTGRAQEAAPSCPPASLLGTVTVGAGAGPNPFYTSSARAYLAGPYKGAPASLAVIAPAVAGPFDLGSVVVRNALQVDPTTAQIMVISDPLPSILHGIPLDLRDVRVNIDRDHFTLNPTNCDPMAIAATVTSTQGASAAPSVPFQAAGCDRLGFKPRLSLRLKGGTKRSQYPALTVVMLPRPGDANAARIQVALPHSEFLAQNHIRTICTRVQFAAESCPRGSVYGKVSAISPILDYPLQGKVYLRSSDNPLPDMVLALRGPAHQPIAIDAVGRIDSKDGGIRTTFPVLPDAPLTKVTVSFPGGKKGLLENSRDICKSIGRAAIGMNAHNAKSYGFAAPLKAKCPKQGRRSRRR